MPSPFPGMNPYLEQNDTWEDFHTNFIVHARSLLSSQMGPNNFVKIAVRLQLNERNSHLEIRDCRDRSVVTVIELLSPTNKTPGAEHDAYVGKRRSLLASHTHLVEIDLRRGGLRPYPPALPPSDYYVLVSKYEHRPRVGLWPLSLRDPLPIVPIPLTAPDPDVRLDLQALLHRVYDGANYGKYIYGEIPQPPLLPDDAAWSRQFVPPTRP